MLPLSTYPTWQFILFQTLHQYLSIPPRSLHRQPGISAFWAFPTVLYWHLKLRLNTFSPYLSITCFNNLVFGSSFIIFLAKQNRKQKQTPKTTRNFNLICVEYVPSICKIKFTLKKFPHQSHNKNKVKGKHMDNKKQTKEAVFHKDCGMLKKLQSKHFFWATLYLYYFVLALFIFS